MSVRKRVRTETATSWYGKIKSIVGSELFFRLTLLLFVLQAGIIAVVSGFPLAFDEGFHLGVIQLHATQLSPFFSNLPDSTGQFGALVTDPSYLYHYLMSFPYRLITTITNDTFAIVLFLRFINVALFAAGIVVFRKVLKFTGASNALINLVLLAFVALPLQTFTAAQINYDNLLFLATAAALLFCLRFTEKLRTTKQFDTTNFALTIAACLFAAQVKYVFMPIFAAIAVFVGFTIAKWVYTDKKKALASIKTNTLAVSTRMKFVLISLLLITGGMFAYRFGYNLTKYQAISPDCSKVLGVEACMQYGTWARNYELSQTHTPSTSWAQQKAFVRAWTGITGGQLFTILDGNRGGITVQPVGQFLIGATIIVIGGFALVLLQWRKINKIDHATGLILLVSGAYLVALISKNYSEYVQYGMPIAMQGRYLLPILLLLMVLLAQIYSITLKTKPVLKLAVLAFIVAVGVQGGGIVTYALRTNDESWRWTNTALVPTQDLTNVQASQAGLKQ
ncbi:MAG: DUF2142 domain-containing protein [Candidatus Saccharimonadales bacterium]